MGPRPRASTCGATLPSTLANAQNAWNSGQHVHNRLVLGRSMLPGRPVSGDGDVLAGSSVSRGGCLLMRKCSHSARQNDGTEVRDCVSDCALGRAGRLESGPGSERRKSRSQPLKGRGDIRTHTPLNALKSGVSAPFGTIETDETKTREVIFCERANSPPPYPPSVCADWSSPLYSTLAHPCRVAKQCLHAAGSPQ